MVSTGCRGKMKVAMAGEVMLTSYGGRKSMKIDQISVNE